MMNGAALAELKRHKRAYIAYWQALIETNKTTIEDGIDTEIETALVLGYINDLDILISRKLLENG